MEGIEHFFLLFFSYAFDVRVVRVISNGITIWGENLMNKYEKNLLDCIKTVEEEVAKLEAEADCA